MATCELLGGIGGSMAFIARGNGLYQWRHEGDVGSGRTCVSECADEPQKRCIG
jgi:hypothetical protein